MGEGTIIIGRGVDIPYYIIYIGDGRKTLPRPLCKRGEQIQRGRSEHKKTRNEHFIVQVNTGTS